jgi:two-component sensor histidine kinase
MITYHFGVIDERKFKSENKKAKLMDISLVGWLIGRPDRNFASQLSVGFISPETAGAELHSAIDQEPDGLNSKNGVLLSNGMSFSIINGVLLKIFNGLFFLGVVLLGVVLYNGKRRYSGIIKQLRKQISDKSSCLELVSEERDWLVKEIHHRVKNNLQIVMSLLNTQLSYLTNEEAIKAVRSSQHRMYAISLVHQKLYQTDNLSDIDMVAYTHELLEYIQDAYKPKGGIYYQLEMVSLSLDVSMAVPFGLIINEAISNILKYAFVSDSEGKVTVTLNSADRVNYTLDIADNGIGLSEDYEIYSANSFGTNLMAGLANQLGGSFEMKNNNGVEIIVEFNKK